MLLLDSFICMTFIFENIWELGLFEIDAGIWILNYSEIDYIAMIRDFQIIQQFVIVEILTDFAIDI